MATPKPTPPVFEIEVSLRRATYGRIAGELRFQDPSNESDVRFSDVLAPLDMRALEETRFDPRRYGTMLGRWIMSSRRSREALLKVVAQAQSAEAVMRVRLNIADDATELHRVRWEAARLGKRLLFVGENVLFSRYVNSTDFRRIQRRSRGDLRAMIVVASPTDLAAYGTADAPVAAIDAAKETARARTAFGDIPVDTIELPKRATLENIATALRAEAYDILYLICHGGIIDRQPHLWLEAEDGTSDVVQGDEFTARIAELRQRPSLIVLASCESAGADGVAIVGDDGVLAALGPRLAEEGIPAVIAMQGTVSIDTIERFMPRFFEELAIDGQLDRGVAVARGAVRERMDAWAIVLFTRLKGGGIWYRIGWDSGDGFKRWKALTQAIANQKCTPILGPGLLESIHGSRREIARELAEQFHFPLAPQDRDELPQVAQYWLVQQSRDSVVSHYMHALIRRIQRRYRDILPAELLAPFTEDPVPTSVLSDRCVALLTAAWQYRRAKDRMDPHTLLASLDFPVFISTNHDPLLSNALTEADTKTPCTEIFRWSPSIDQTPSVFDNPQAATFDKNRPLVYQLFGQLDVPESIVLAQDDYFDALIAASGEGRLPQVVKGALTNRTLLFLGFNIDDWNFRVLFRFILNLPGAHLLRNHPHVAVQVDPEEQRFYDPRAARNYLEDYFSAQQIDIYWGTVDDFIRDLKKAHTAPAVVT
jgi:hypothetical protein